MASLRTKLSRSPEQKMDVLEHNIHIKLLFPLAALLISLPFLPLSIFSLSTGVLSGFLVAVFFIPPLHWQKSKITRALPLALFKTVGMGGFVLMTALSFFAHMSSTAVHGSWFFIQYSGLYMSTFLLVVMGLKTRRDSL